MQSSSRFGGKFYSGERKCLIDTDGSEIALRPRSLALFEYLAARPGVVVDKATLLNAVWPDTVVTDDSLTQCVADIRRAIGDGKHQVLRTVPRQGYRLVEDAADSIGKSNVAGESISKAWWRMPAWRWGSGVLVIALIGLFASLSPFTNPSETRSNQIESVSEKSAQSKVMAAEALPVDRAPTLAIEVTNADSVSNSLMPAYLAELRAVLSRYKTIALVQASNVKTDYRLKVGFTSGESSDLRLHVEVVDQQSGQSFSARSFDVPNRAGAAHELAARTAAFASPAGGDLSRHLMATAIHKPVDQLTSAECYAHAYDCTTCAGELNHVAERTDACLSRLLNRNPNNATALALKGALHAHQYRWGSALPEPERTDLHARRYRARMAIEAATRAEELSDGTDPAVYWGLVQAYQSTCEVDKMWAAMERGIALNPDDPGMLAVYGSWLAYAGRWEDGEAMINRSLAIEPVHYRRWWLMALAKRDYSRGEYSAAYETFLKSFQARNWVSHLQLAYTLPYLDRLAEARAAVREAMRLNPGVTLEKTLQFYQVGCVDESYIKKIERSLIAAGLPSRGSRDDYQRIETIPAKVATVNGVPLEYIDMGEGEPIVFVHGGFADYRAWSHFETPISERHRFIAYTQRYYGTRNWAKPATPPDQYTYSDDLSAFIENLRVGPVHLVTWSGGGKTGLIVQATRPDLVKSAVHFEPVTDAILDFPSRYADTKKAVFDERIARATKLITEHNNWNGAVMRAWEIVTEQKEGAFDREIPGLQRMLLDNAETLALALGGTIKGDMLTCDYVSRIQTPTLIVSGRGTNRYWRAMSSRFAKCIPGARLSILDGGSHDAPIRNVSGFVRMVRDHVDSSSQMSTGGSKQGGAPINAAGSKSVTISR